MPLVFLVLQIAIILLSPWLWIHLTRRWQIETWLSPVVLSYATGILLANTGLLPLSESISTGFVSATVLLAIPLLLYSTNIKAWLMHARSTILSFVLCVLSGIIASVVVGLWCKDLVADHWILSGMLVGIYTGGTANVNAIGLALGAKQELLVLINAADILCGGIYLIFLTSIGHRVFGSFLPAFTQSKTLGLENQATLQQSPITWLGIGQSLLLTIGVVGISLGICYLTTGKLESLSVILLLLTTFSIIASFSPKVRNISGTFEMGEYLLLMFSVAIGMKADFGAIISEGGPVILFTAGVLGTTVVIHLLLARLFRIDVDTVMITSTAALYSPVFIGQIASAIRNRSLVFSGMVTGLVGFALGNYLGILVAYWVKG